MSKSKSGCLKQQGEASDEMSISKETQSLIQENISNIDDIVNKKIPDIRERFNEFRKLLEKKDYKKLRLNDFKDTYEKALQLLDDNATLSKELIERWKLAECEKNKFELFYKKECASHEKTFNDLNNFKLMKNIEVDSLHHELDEVSEDVATSQNVNASLNRELQDSINYIKRMSRTIQKLQNELLTLKSDFLSESKHQEKFLSSSAQQLTSCSTNLKELEGMHFSMASLITGDDTVLNELSLSIQDDSSKEMDAFSLKYNSEETNFRINPFLNDQSNNIKSEIVATKIEAEPCLIKERCSIEKGLELFQNYLNKDDEYPDPNEKMKLELEKGGIHCASNEGIWFWNVKSSDLTKGIPLRSEQILLPVSMSGFKTVLYLAFSNKLLSVKLELFPDRYNRDLKLEFPVVGLVHVIFLDASNGSKLEESNGRFDFKSLGDILPVCKNIDGSVFKKCQDISFYILFKKLSLNI